MVSNKRIIRHMHKPIQYGENMNLIADAIIREIGKFLIEVTNLKQTIQLSTAEGTYLDDIGQILGLSRNIGESDTDFRARIKAFWPGYSGSGTIEDIKNTINRLVGIDLADITLTEIEHSKIKIEFDATFEELALAETLRNVVWDVKAAGVYPFFKYTTAASESVTVSESASISVTNNLYWGYFDWGESLW